MSLFGGDKNEQQHPEEKPEQSEQRPEQQEPERQPEQTVEQEGEQKAKINAEGAEPASRPAQPYPDEYWVRNNGPQRPTTPSGYGQGYQQPYQQPNQPPNQGYPPYYNGNYPQQSYRPVPYQYNPNSGWQQPQTRQPDNYQWNFQDYDKAAGGKTKKKKSRGTVVLVVSLICVLALGLTGISAYGVYSYLNQNYSDVMEFPGENEAFRDEAQIEIVSKPQISESLPVGGKMTIPQVYQAVAPSVVGVVQYQPDKYLDQTGSGSGIIMSADGYIITNAHVVAEGTAFKVILADGTPKDADLVGADSLTDLAVLKVSGVNDLVPAVFGDSTQIEVGEQVIAIGNPAGVELAGSVTMGVISGANREIPAAGNIPLIQTDAAINPGNSGGALVNEYGQVIGINSSKIVAAEYEGIGFAIPISEAKPIVDDIVTNGRVTGRVKLGIRAREIDEIDARQAGLQMGIRIESIDPDSDLMDKNVQRFDIITHIDGERVYTMYDLKNILELYKPGDRITLTLFRQVSTTRSENIDVSIILLEDK